MDQFRAEQLEKIRWQIGVIIKSWPKVDRVVLDDEVHYVLGETVFCILKSNQHILRPATSELADQLKDQYDVELLNPKELSFSLDTYEFTDLIPITEEVYRSHILRD